MRAFLHNLTSERSDRCKPRHRLAARCPVQLGGVMLPGGEHRGRLSCVTGQCTHGMCPRSGAPRWVKGRCSLGGAGNRKGCAEEFCPNNPKVSPTRSEIHRPEQGAIAVTSVLFNFLTFGCDEKCKFQARRSNGSPFSSWVARSAVKQGCYSTEEKVLLFS